MRALLALPVLLAACGTPAPVVTSAADKDACATAARTEVAKRDAKTFPRWLGSALTRWGQIGDKENACLSVKGYAVTRACTAEELHAPTHPNVIVTSNGVRCQDPGRPSSS